MTATESPLEVLEARYWGILRNHQVTCREAAGLMRDLLAAAVDYAAGDDDELCGLRRDVLDRARHA